MTCFEQARDDDPGYRVFYSKYGQDFTLRIDDGGASAYIMVL